MDSNIILKKKGTDAYYAIYIILIVEDTSVVKIK